MSALEQALSGNLPTEADALALADFSDTKALADVASALRDRGFRNEIGRAHV